MSELGFSDTEAKGRNGYFKANRATVVTIDGKVWLEVFSKRQGGSAPIRMEMSVEDTRVLADVLLFELSK